MLRSIGRSLHGNAAWRAVAVAGRVRVRGAQAARRARVLVVPGAHARLSGARRDGARPPARRAAPPQPPAAGSGARPTRDRRKPH